MKYIIIFALAIIQSYANSTIFNASESKRIFYPSGLDYSPFAVAGLFLNIVENKNCNDCNKPLPVNIEYFPKAKNVKSGISGTCRNCLGIKAKDYYYKNQEKQKRKAKEYARKNKKLRSEYQKQWWDKNPNYRKQYYDNNIEKMRKLVLEYRNRNIQKCRDSKKRWDERNKDKVRRWQKLYRERKKGDICYMLKMNVTRGILTALKQNTKKSKSSILLGCSIQIYKKHLENQFDKNMTWANYGKYWHIDHKIPCASFELSKKEEQEKCFHYRNTQPLEKIENIKKGAKIIEGTQIAMVI